MKIQVIDKQRGKYTLEIEGKEYVFMPPMALFSDEKLLPLRPFVPKNKSIVMWKIDKNKQVSYNAIKKAIISAAFVLLFVFSNGQKRDNFWLKQGISAASMAAAGWLHATNEVSVHDYRRFAARHPDANPQWANPRLSFLNKYENWPHDKSAAFFGSKTVLVFTTDAYHLRSTARNFLIAGNIGVTMSLYEKPNWKQILVQAASSWAFFSFGSGAAHHFYKPID